MIIKGMFKESKKKKIIKEYIPMDLKIKKEEKATTSGCLKNVVQVFINLLQWINYQQLR